MGGVVAQHFALRHPARVLRLLLVATGGFTPNAALALEKADALSRAPWTEETVVPIVDGFFHRRPSDEKIAGYRRIALSASQKAAVEAARSNANNRSFDSLASIRVPTMIVQGRFDRARTPEHGAEMRDRIAGSVLEVIEDAGHTPQLEQPEAFHQVRCRSCSTVSFPRRASNPHSSGRPMSPEREPGGVAQQMEST
jgi:pimeloyl-ACP methyl ester carboxylesterase